MKGLSERQQVLLVIPAAAAALQEAGKSVSAQRVVPEKLRYRELVDLRGGARDA